MKPIGRVQTPDTSVDGVSSVTYCSVMEPDPLFVRTLDDVESRIAGDEYDVVKSSELLRGLLLDGLVSKVNRTRRLKLEFVVTRNDAYLRTARALGNMSYFSVIDGIDPSSNMPGQTTHSLSLGQFIKEPIMYLGAQTATVRDVVKYGAIVAGGTHSTEPKPGIATSIDEWARGFSPGGMPTGTIELRPIARVALTTLKPLRDQVISEAK
ncbi:MAG: hypothetical protein KDB57_04950 [Solirubrobacterales bacterium]|nr:hypothetical protein [Solirubrobacterales bacterium]